MELVASSHQGQVTACKLKASFEKDLGNLKEPWEGFRFMGGSLGNLQSLRVSQETCTNLELVQNFNLIMDRQKTLGLVQSCVFVAKQHLSWLCQLEAPSKAQHTLEHTTENILKKFWQDYSLYDNDCRAQLQVLVQVQSSAQKLKTQNFSKLSKVFETCSLSGSCSQINRSVANNNQQIN